MEEKYQWMPSPSATVHSSDSVRFFKSQSRSAYVNQPVSLLPKMNIQGLASIYISVIRQGKEEGVVRQNEFVFQGQPYFKTNNSV